MEDNLTLAIVVFAIGFVAVLITTAAILIAHVRSERTFQQEEEAEEV